MKLCHSKTLKNQKYCCQICPMKTNFVYIKTLQRWQNEKQIVTINCGNWQKNTFLINETLHTESTSHDQTCLKILIPNCKAFTCKGVSAMNGFKLEDTSEFNRILLVVRMDPEIDLCLWIWFERVRLTSCII